MSAIIIIHADDPDFAEFLQDAEYGGNAVFQSVEHADIWLQENAQVGWCTRIIDLDD